MPMRVRALAVACTVTSVVVCAQSETVAAAGLQWSAPSAVPHSEYVAPAIPTTIACPSSSLCVAGGPGGLLTSTDPAAGGGSFHPVETASQAVEAPQPACIQPPPELPPGVTVELPPGATLCSPSSAPLPPPTPSAPSQSPLARFYGTSISCSSVSLCVAGGYDDTAANPRKRLNELFTSTNPTGGPGAWSETTLPGTGGVRGVSCMGTTLCVAVTGNHAVLTSTDPTGGASAWHATDIYPYEATKSGTSDALTCAPGLCLIAGNEGYVIGASNPLEGLSAWVGTSVQYESPLYGVACVSRKLCIETAGPSIESSTDAGHGGGAWRPDERPMRSGRLYANYMSATCTPGGLCVAGGGVGASAGIVSVDTNVVRHPHSWLTTRVGNGAIVAVACPANDLCVAANERGEVLVGS